MIPDSFIEQFGVELVQGNEREARGYCPVHHIVKGRPSSSAKWYMNRATGAWICFSCQQSGSLSHLVDMLNLDQDLLGNMPVEIERSRLEAIATVKEEKEAKPLVYISQYAFDKNPYPPRAVSEHRNITREMCEMYNVRWSAEGRCYLIPIMSFDGKLVGWQEKSVGYFLNVPDEVPKSLSLFGYQQLHGTTAILVESPLDVLRMASVGFSGGVAIYGAFPSDEQLYALSQAAETVLLACDNDEAGQKANDRAKRVLSDLGVEVKVVAYPPLSKYGKDPGEWPDGQLALALQHASSFKLSTRLLRR